MAYLLPLLFVLGAYVALPVVLVAGWVQWAGRWQIRSTWPSLTGFSLGTASALLAVGSMLYARAVGGFPFYDPSLLRIYRWGLILSLGPNPTTLSPGAICVALMSSGVVRFAKDTTLGIVFAVNICDTSLADIC